MYFQDNISKIDYYRDFGDDLELDELLRKNSSVETEPTRDCNFRTSGLAAFHSTTNPCSLSSEDVVEMNIECEVDHGCSCNTGDIDIIFDDVAENLTNEDKREWNKMKKAIRKWEDDETLSVRGIF